MTASQRSLMADLGWGLSWGISFGIVYAVVGGALYALGCAAAKAKYGLGTPTVLGFYLLGGIGAGLFVGLFRPILRSKAGAMLAGAKLWKNPPSGRQAPQR